MKRTSIIAAALFALVLSNASFAQEAPAQAPAAPAAQKAPTPTPTPKATPSKPAAARKKAAPAKKAAPKAKPRAKPKGKGKDAAGRSGLVSKVQRPGYVKTYHKDLKVKTAGGHVSIDTNDNIAQRLRGMSLKDVYEEASKTLKESVQALKKKYGHLNLGMQRMNLGNRMRAA